MNPDVADRKGPTRLASVLPWRLGSRLARETALALATARRNPWQELFPQRSTRRAPAKTSSTQAAGVFLPVGAPGLGARGILVGRDLYAGTSFIYDPFELYAAGILQAPHVLVNGMSGRGKSALVKTFVLRFLTRRKRSVVVLDAQGDAGHGEWTALAAELGVTPIRVAPGEEGSVVVNPLDPSIAPDRQRTLLEALLVIELERSLTPEEKWALRLALAAARSRVAGEGRALVLGDVLRELSEPAGGRLGIRAVDAATALSWSEPLALGLDSLLSGVMSNAFDGPTSEGIDLDSNLVIFDLSAMDRTSKAVPLLMAVMGEWLRHSWIRPDGVKRMLVCEEAWDYLRHEAVADLVKELLKYGRRFGVSVWLVMHHPGDVSHSPAAQEILKLADTRIVYGLGATEAETVGALFELPAWARKLLSSTLMGQGNAVWSVGGRTMFVQHVRSEVEVALSNTDKGMVDEAA